MFGVLAIAGCRQTYERLAPKLGNERLLHEFLYLTTANNYSRMIVSPDLDDTSMLTGYETIVFLDTPPGYALAGLLAKRIKAKIYVPQTDNQAQFFEGVDCGRESFGACFTALRQNQTLSADNILSYYKILSTRHPIGMAQFMAGVAVFAELDLIRIQ